MLHHVCITPLGPWDALQDKWAEYVMCWRRTKEWNLGPSLATALWNTLLPLITISKALSDLMSAPHPPWRTNRNMRSLWVWRGTVRLEHSYSSKDNPESPPGRVSFLPKTVVCSPFTLICPRRREGKWKLLQKTLREGLGLRETQNGHWGKLCNCGGSTAQHGTGQRSFSFLWFMFAIQEEELWADQHRVAGWIKALGKSSVHVLSSRCLCLHRLLCVSSMTVCSWGWTEARGEQSQNAICVGIVWFVVLLSRKSTICSWSFLLLEVEEAKVQMGSKGTTQAHGWWLMNGFWMMSQTHQHQDF